MTKRAASAAENKFYFSDEELDAHINQRVDQKFNEKIREGFIALKTIGQLIIWHPHRAHRRPRGEEQGGGDPRPGWPRPRWLRHLQAWCDSASRRSPGSNRG